MSRLPSVFKDVMSRFPSDHIKYAFCYGSGAFQQRGSDMSANVLDFVLVVDETKQFHKDNLKRNNSDYSFIKYFGTNGVSSVQGRGVYYNTLIKHGPRIIKYGVISSQDLKNDLLEWTTLYLSGRLHKPVHKVHNAGDHSISKALRINLDSAVHSSLLLLPESFTALELYTTIASLSYKGDFRMVVGEDKNKINNIVIPNLQNFQNLYDEVLLDMQHLSWNDSSQAYEQSLCSESRLYHLNHLPGNVLGRIRRGLELENGTMKSLSVDPFRCSTRVSDAISDIVKSSSFQQTLRAAATAGFVKSVKYAAAKLSKMMKSQSSVASSD